MIFEPDHDIAEQLQPARQFQIDYPLFLEVEFYLRGVILISVDLLLVQSIYLEDFVKWFIAAIAETTRQWHISDGYPFEILDLWRQYLFPEESLEIMDESYLTRLANTLSIRESAGAEKLGSLVHGIIKSKIYEQTTCGSSCSTLSRIAMDNNDVFGISYWKRSMISL